MVPGSDICSARVLLFKKKKSHKFQKGALFIKASAAVGQLHHSWADVICLEKQLKYTQYIIYYILDTYSKSTTMTNLKVAEKYFAIF